MLQGDMCIYGGEERGGGKDGLSLGRHRQSPSTWNLLLAPKHFRLFSLAFPVSVELKPLPWMVPA